MLPEFALEPSLLSNWSNVQFYLVTFGVQHGRLISRYPRYWERLVLAGLSSCGVVERKRIEEALIRLKQSLLARHHEWNDTTPWLENAEEEHTKRPFHAIIASNNPRTLASVLLGGDIGEPQPPPLWAAPRSKVVPRQPADMAATVKNLLRCARTVMFVDGNFKPKVSRFRLPLEEFLLHLLDRTKRPTAAVIQYHVGVEKHDATDFKSLCQAWMPAHIPAGMRVEFVLWDPNDLHNRYVITDRGAIQFGEGLDQAGPTGRPTDVVTVLDLAVAEQLFLSFTSSPPQYTLVDRITIGGTKSV
jgi:hypothetical protein